MGGNYLSGLIPEWLGTCENLSLLDLSSNYLEGLIPVNLGVHRMIFFNVSRNSLSGPISFDNSARSSVSNSKDGGLLENEKLLIAYFDMLLQNARKGNPYEFVFDDINFVVLHDFSWNEFVGPLPALFNLGGADDTNFSYGLLLNNNKFNGSLTPELFRLCGEVIGLALNLSNNQIQGNLDLISSCSQLKSFEAAYNRLNGPLPYNIGLLLSLLNLDLRGNYLKGMIPEQLGNLKFAEQILLGANNLSGEIPVQLGQMTSLKLLDLSQNFLRGAIPQNLVKAAKLELLLLDHNQLSGSIPSNFSMLINLTALDVSYNNLSGSIPHLVHSSDCKFFRGNLLLQPCLIPTLPSPSSIPSEGDLGKRKLKPLIIAAVTPAAVLVLILIVLVNFLISRTRKLVRITSLRRKVLVTFTDVPAELNYENVVKATGNFSIQNLIGSGGFGSTYKAELAPGFLVAVKRLAMNRFHGLQQFDAEIRTLGRIRHKNLVTLIGYHMGESDTFLIYNYLSQGNLETFIQKMHGGDVNWPLIHKIAVDVAQALCYLHYSCVPRIVHRDIKPSNILLDEKLNAYLSDFGLARLLEVSETHATTDVAGTFGYVAPEYAMTCRVSDKSDVYSFGVVLLELISGKRSLDPSFSEFGNGFMIVTWGRLLIKEGRSSELFVPSLWDAGPKDRLISMLKLALSCTAESLSVRPSMKKVLERLKQLKS